MDRASSPPGDLLPGLERLDTRSGADVAAVVALHTALLPTSPVVRLGARFAQEFYYGTLVDGGLIGCVVCKREGRVVGFISFTTHATDLWGTGMRRHFGALASVLLRSVWRSPAVIGQLLVVVRLLLRRGGQVPPPPPGAGEGLTVATDPSHRDYVPPGGGTRMPVRLFDQMIDSFRRRGVPAFFVLVEPGNISSRRYCEARGCHPEVIQAGGESRIRYLYRFDAGAA